MTRLKCEQPLGNPVQNWGVTERFLKEVIAQMETEKNA